LGQPDLVLQVLHRLSRNPRRKLLILLVWSIDSEYAEVLAGLNEREIHATGGSDIKWNKNRVKQT
jgi:hypothetical protein